MPTTPPVRDRRTLLIAGVGGLVVLAALGAGSVYLVLFGSTAPRLTLQSAASTTSASTSATASLQAGQGAGSWTVAGGSVAGYRVREQLAFVVAPSDAAGRTRRSRAA